MYIREGQEFQYYLYGFIHIHIRMDYSKIHPLSRTEDPQGNWLEGEPIWRSMVVPRREVSDVLLKDKFYIIYIETIERLFPAFRSFKFMPICPILQCFLAMGISNLCFPITFGVTNKSGKTLSFYSFAFPNPCSAESLPCLQMKLQPMQLVYHH